MLTGNGQLFATCFWRVCIRLVMGIVSTWVVAESSRAQQQVATAPKGYEQIAKPFLTQHCLGCHGPATTKAGYRVDLIGTDFSAATVAEHWKEVIDRINAGEMPPKDNPRPDARQSAAFVTWVNEQLRQVDLAGGARLGVKHQGHLIQEDVRLGNLWSTVFDRMQVPLPKNFQGGEADGSIKELV